MVVKLVAALSGGVDSAVAAARLVDAGHEVVGVHLALLPASGVPPGRRGGCCTPSDARDAARVADALGIDFYVWDFADLFAREVIEPFVAEYAAGRTPNPCVRCNERIKFAGLLDRVLGLGFDGLATGHYAELDHDLSGRAILRRAVDLAKDQSYVLASLTPQQLSHAHFPLGGSRKEEVRSEALRRGFKVAGKADSTDICFIPDGDTAGWIRDRLAPAPGPIIDAVTGREVGRHEGAEVFTIGQRRGLGITLAPEDGRRRYVIETDPEAGIVRVGPAQLLEVTNIAVKELNWHRPVSLPLSTAVQFRAHGAEHSATVEVKGDLDPSESSAEMPGEVNVRLVTPAQGVALGQTLVAYQGRMVLASGVITGD